MQDRIRAQYQSETTQPDQALTDQTPIVPSPAIELNHKYYYYSYRTFAIENHHINMVPYDYAHTKLISKDESYRNSS